MDLVDIDKVLDDFELNDERSGAAAAVDSGRRAFVAVSSVFSSLNDYVGVEIASKAVPEVHEKAAEEAATTDTNENSAEKVNGETVSEDVPNSVDEEETLERSSEIVLSLTTTTESSSSDLSNPSVNTTELSEDVLSLDAGTKVSNMLTLESSSICIDNDISSSVLPSKNFGNNMSTLSRITETEDNSEPEMSDEMRPEEEEEVIIPRETPQPPIKVPVGFEETMDDVSDTELESYLQELENESIRETENPQVVAEKVEESPKAVDQHDSVSQASTVEITDTKKRIEIDFDDESTSNSSLLEEKVTEEVVDEPTTCSLSVSEVEVHPHEEEKAEAAPEVAEDEEKEEQVELRQKDDIEEVAEVAEETPQEVIEVKPQRPDSLDLSMVANAGLAGQTPMQPEPVEEGAVGGEDEAVSVEAAAQMSTSSSDDFTPMAQPPAVESSAERRLSSSMQTLGKVAPYWIPDNVTNFCMQCNLKFSLIKRRHHCRACGQVLCSTCCSLRGKLEYMGDVEARICIQCDAIMSRDAAEMIMNNNTGCLTRSPNPNNPMEYCSTIPPHQQVSGNAAGPIAVMVPAGVLKKEGAPSRGRKDKTVIFSDGIRPGCDLTELDGDESEGRSSRRNGNWRVQTPPGPASGSQKASRAAAQQNVKLPVKDKVTGSYIPKEENLLPPIYIATKTDFRFEDVANNAALIARLRQETLKFAIHRNFHIHVKIIELTCCMNRTVFNFTTHGLRFVGQDEIIILLEMDSTEQVPKDIFLHLCEIYSEADRGQTITELGFSLASSTTFLGSREHGGFLYIRPTFQCLQGVCVPEPPYLIGILIHKWEIPWARLFPLRLQLRLGAYYRYYPSPHVSFRGRESVYTEISDTIINFLADFRTYSYTLSSIRGLLIHMEDRHTTVMIPRNRYDQVMKAINNSSDNILAIGGNFSRKADGHLVCIQNTDADSGQLHAYSTQAINIEGHPRNVTGASFIVLNGALKTTSGLTGKCSIVEDGLMVQILPAKMETVRTALKNMKDVTIVCGAIDADPSQTENVNIVWTENDLEFNVGVVSPIDNKKMDGIPSIRVHKGQDFSSANHIIRWTEVFILKVEDDSSHSSVNIPKVAEQIAQSTAVALVSFLDLLAANGLRRIGLRTTLDQETVCYEAGSHQQKLPPLYMDVLDNELIPTLHRQVTNLQIDNPIIVELIFDILDK
ncbi:zinc finger FYVE domain-containing protein 9 [Lutzomyia longipalpis]|uniref:zinc finger FYVE domain-containing protein 9 n=1 Tax=Lutzomyia longipalpis TaxID=7200 RepID=UPI002484676C|nr:zinc finger FYVE domain-containing protein 9 [Lutzomyia longipalpis]